MTSLILALMLTVDAGVSDAGTVDTTLTELRRLAKPLEAHVKTPWVKSWVRAVNTLKPVAKPETYYCSMSRCEQSAFDGGVRREITDEFYYARIADPLGYARPSVRLATLQPYLYGGGQLLHVTGLVWSGGYGVQRKVAGAEQVLHTNQEIAGMGLMGLGGLIAVAGGILFVFVVLQAMWRARQIRQTS